MSTNFKNLNFLWKRGMTFMIFTTWKCRKIHINRNIVFLETAITVKMHTLLPKFTATYPILNWFFQTLSVIQNPRYLIDIQTGIQTAHTSIFRYFQHIFLFFKVIQNSLKTWWWWLNIWTWNEPLLAGILHCMDTITPLSKNRHSLLWSHRTLITIWNMTPINLKWFILMRDNVFNYQTKGQVPIVSNCIIVTTKWMGYKLLLFPKITEPCIKPVSSWCTMGSCIMHSSLRSSCIMLHKPTEIHALTYT